MAAMLLHLLELALVLRETTCLRLGFLDCSELGGGGGFLIVLVVGPVFETAVEEGRERWSEPCMSKDVIRPDDPDSLRKQVVQPLQLLDVRLLGAHDSLPLPPLLVIQETLVDRLRKGRLVESLADENDLLSAISPLALEVGFDGGLVGEGRKIRKKKRKQILKRSCLPLTTTRSSSAIGHVDSSSSQSHRVPPVKEN